MKKLYRKGTVHPSPPLISDHLAFLPAAILTLTVALSPEDREVLAYLISCSGSSPVVRRNNNQSKSGACKGGDHPTLFNCSCFRCYTSYWARWDSSPNRQLIHEIIDGFEDWLVAQSKSGNAGKNKKQERRNNKRGFKFNEPSEDSKKRPELGSGRRAESGEADSATAAEGGAGGEGCDGGGDAEEGLEKGSVRKLVSYIGEKIWNVWGP
ncbi:uncharacterized protein LOC131153406 [Malania oleifera]|uniref:uncharacterized protein LOC131153406 n=1 Tax=Malania oleifera TaxID=397392 RepID=UPI0025ADCC5D|nr:uncharacterized protein LOC131153406 [Malania oleifera]